MTVQEFHINFNIELDKTLDFELPYMSVEQIDYWLNKAQDRFVKSRAFGNNLFKTSFEESQKRIEDLRTILKQSSPITPTLIGTTYSTLLPIDYLFGFRHQCYTLIPGCNTPILAAGIQVTQDELNILSRDPFWESIPYDPLYYYLGSAIVYEGVIGFSIQSTILTYIRKYNRIQYGSQYINPVSDIQCELAIHTHQEILDIAISLVLENIESPRYQTNINELTKIE
jgi:hypothetical protein